MELCSACLGFAEAISLRVKEYSPFADVPDRDSPDAFWSRAYVSHLPLSSQTCHLCRAIYDYVDESSQEPKYSLVGTYHYKAGKVNAITLDGFTPKLRISVWGDEGSPAAMSGSICTEPPCPSQNGPAAFRWINSQIQACREDHSRCRAGRSHATILPTRVLDVGQAQDDTVFLIESLAQQADYCALSYCWGSPEHNLLTTATNIKEHFNGIKLAHLPKTFQDAVTVTRAIGVRYLWIDSLCIIQGDKEDWAAECGRMTQVYRDAFLVIAASGASHPGEGCFSSLSRFSRQPVQVPFFSEGGKTAGSMWLAVQRKSDDDLPEYGPLAQRGWALQEWNLARRILHFVPENMFWRCDTLQAVETGYVRPAYHDDWDILLERFSKSYLTYKTDRLPALQGLAQLIGARKFGGYVFGIFRSDLPGCLLWVLTGESLESDDLPDIPSWSWASTGGEKLFWAGRDMYSDALLGSLQIRIEASGVLRVIDGYVRQCQIAQPSVPGSRLDVTLSGLPRRLPTCYIQYSSELRTIVGFAHFDREIFTSATLIFVRTTSQYHPEPYAPAVSGRVRLLGEEEEAINRARISLACEVRTTRKNQESGHSAYDRTDRRERNDAVST